MRVLLVDNNINAREALGFVLRDQGWAVDSVGSGKEALNLVSVGVYDVAVFDLSLPDMDGFDFLRKIRLLSPDTRLIVISASLGVPETVQATKLGAYHCFTKPLALNLVRDTIAKLVTPNEGAKSAGSTCELVAVSQAMLEMSRNLRAIARGKTTTVLITGETGTGKEVVSRRLHRLSERRDKPFVAINCSAIPASLIESELFGHEKGAFTDARATRKGYFESAEDGTIFLDEIGDLSLELQAKLLRVLQERTFRRVGGTAEIPLRARVVTATHVNLPKAVKAGTFRQDLYYRLAVIPIHLLPLRERRDDILPLAERFIRHLSSEMNCEPPVLTADHRKRLLQHDWQGNVRELRNVIERFVLMDGQLEFCTSSNSATMPAVPASPAPQSNKPQTAIDANERRMLYTEILRELLDSGVNLPKPLTIVESRV
jgi:two-component system, NtrC family, response regulator AtoC